MRDNRLFIKYKVAGKIFVDDHYQTQHYFIEDSSNDNELKMTIVPKTPIELVAFEVRYERKFGDNDRFFANGYQSWTTSSEYSVFDQVKGITPLANISPKYKYLASISGDYLWKPYPKKKGVFRSYSYTYIRNGENVELWGSLSEREGYTVFNVDMADGKFVVEKDVEGCALSGPYQILNVVKFNGRYDEVFNNYFALMNLPKPRINHMAGYTSWYNYFQKIDESIILRDLDGLDRVKDYVNIFQVDDGYEPFIGDWLEYSPKFPNGMKFIADRIHDKGVMAGIWLAPFNAQIGSKLEREHQDWLIKKPNGKPALGCMPWGGAYTLDLYNEGAREYIKHVFDVVCNEWGFDMVKLDFLYSQCAIPRGGKTRGQIMCEAMDFLRECVGEKLILGCGVPLAPAFGKVDACRISCDADLKYPGKFYATALHICNELPSSEHAIINTIFRRHLNGKAFMNDPDVFFLRDVNLKYNDQQKLLQARVNNLLGNVLFVSDDIGQYSNKAMEIVQKAFKKSDAIIVSAEYVDDNEIVIQYIEDSKKKSISFNVHTGENAIKW